MFGKELKPASGAVHAVERWASGMPDAAFIRFQAGWPVGLGHFALGRNQRASRKLMNRLTLKPILEGQRLVHLLKGWIKPLDRPWPAQRSLREA